MAYAVSEALRDKFERHGIQGVEFFDCKVEKSEQLHIADPDIPESEKLPRYFQMCPTGNPYIDDVGRDKSILIVSEKTMALLKSIESRDMIVETV